MGSTKENRTAQSRLAAYREKRDQEKTTEPFPTGTQRPNQFVIHLHAARRRHYDLRLEQNGVLRSWAVPNGPSLDPDDKRLAVQTEDHPVEYLDFEDMIPEGNYGVGAMIVWDRGVWVEREDDQTGENKLLFELHGHKLRGLWTLVRTKRSPKEWLLIKKVDGWARSGDAAAVSERSVFSGFAVEELGAGETPEQELIDEMRAAGARQRRVNASSLELMLTKPADQAFSRKGWLFELKYDGYRMVAGCHRRAIYLRYRNGGDATEVYPNIAPALRALPYESLVLDGEITVIGENGRLDFGRLASRARLSRGPDIAAAAATHPATYFVFDVLEFGGLDLRPLPLTERKRWLRRLLPALGPVRYADHIEERGVEMYQQAERLGLEGLVAKRGDSKYKAGRSDHWLKLRVDRSADFVIVGYALGKGSRADIGALLLAVWHEGELVYCGRVGTGFKESELVEIKNQLDALRLPDDRQRVPPLELPARRSKHYANVPKTGESVWTEPDLVCEVRLKEVTAEGFVRHPVFSRMRPDKSAAECTSSQGALRQSARFSERAVGTSITSEDRSRDRVAAESRDPAAVGVAARSSSAPAARPETLITRPEKIFWPEHGYTEGDLIAYYRAAARWILPYLEDRPLVLDRYPDGIHGNSFFQKHAPHFTPEWVRTVTIHSRSGERDIEYFVVEDEEALVYMANSGTIPLHVWSSRVATIDRADWSILDPDPKEAPFTDVVKVARAIHELYRQIGLDSFVKTSGKTGIHVLVPLGGQASYEHARMLADLLALIVTRRRPEISTINRSLTGRDNKVYIDAVQNGAGRLLVSPLCVRPFPGAPVSTPLRWREVNAKLDRDKFTIKTVPRRLQRMKEDPMRAVLDVKPDLLGALQLLGELQSG